MLVEKYGVQHISTGDLLRAEVKAGSEIGKQAGALMNAGKLVPDELVIGMVQQRLSGGEAAAKGWLLDGFPRTEAQAKSLAKAGIVPDAFVYLKVPDTVLVERVTGRRSDPVTNKIYHLKFNPPPQDDPAVLARLVQRSDDTEEKVKVRIAQFHANVAAVRQQYEGKIIEVDGTKPKKEVFAAITAKL